MIMRIVNPSFGLSAAAGATVALKPVNWKTDAIALVSNSKPNARELLDGIRDQAQRLPAGRQYRLPVEEQRQPAGAQGPDREGRRQLQRQRCSP